MVKLVKSYIRQAAVLACLLALTGCGTRIGPRTADGTYLNLSGEAVNAYADPLPETVEAGLHVLASLKVPIHFRRADSGRALITATAPDGSPLRIQFVEEGQALTTVKIRTGVAGYWRHEFSYHLHVLIDERLRHEDPASVNAALEVQVSAAQEEAASEAPETVRLPAERPGQTKSTHSKADGVVDGDGSAVDAEHTEKPKVASRPLPARSVESQAEEPEAQIYFETDSNFPKSGELAKLDQIAQQLSANPSWILTIAGFAEAKENSSRPRMVAESRILAVKFYLVGKGVEGRRLVQAAIDLSENSTDPIAPDRRRVDLWLRKTP